MYIFTVKSRLCGSIINWGILRFNETKFCENVYKGRTS